MLKENLENILSEIKNGNNLGESITLVGATKTVDTTIINQAISYGLEYVAENKVQEFNLKHDALINCHQQFIGHLQTNKVKYLIGKVELIQSVDCMNLAKEISRISTNKQVVTNILLEVNIGAEESKSGFSFDEVYENYQIIKNMPFVKVLGLMAMLPKTDDEKKLSALCLQMRNLYDIIKKEDKNFLYLSIGMSQDYKIAIKNGSNMIRLGSRIFGERQIAK